MGKNHTTKELNENANNYVAKEQVYDSINAQKRLGIKSHTAYIEADAFHGNPYSLLGRVIMIRKTDSKCPDGISGTDFISDYTPTAISGIDIDEASKIKNPIKRGSIIVTKDLSLKVSFLNYLSAEFGKNDSFSIMLYDQLTGLVDVHSPTWQIGLRNWIQNNTYLFQDPDVCYLYAIIGIVQKHVIRKSYKKLDAKAGGGAYGVNINGELHTSNEDFSLDIRYGLTPVILKSPTFKIQLPKKELVNNMVLANEIKKPTESLISFSEKYSNKLDYTLPNAEELNVLAKVKM